MHKPLPILYSFRRCPYAMRARLAIAYSGIHVELREVVLKNKPSELLQLSAKATVPVLQCLDGTIIDESRDIMLWALNQHDPDDWLESAKHPCIDENDGGFKQALDHYKYADRFPENSPAYYRKQCNEFLIKIDHLLKKHNFIQNNHLSYVDMAILPFIRQFYLVNTTAIQSQEFPYLMPWLQAQLDSNLFASIMQKYPAWQAGDETTIFP